VLENFPVDSKRQVPEVVLLLEDVSVEDCQFLELARGAF
jgi:hypothetical protein